jgi:imidazolonepropionase-like amidohydrolase
VVAFRDVSVVTMVDDRVLPNQTVIVKDGSIDWIGPAAQADVDPDALVVDGRGSWLMPGLADMHVHTWQEEDQALFVAYGVTTVRNMWGTGIQLAFQSRIASGDLVGPTIVTSGPIMDGDPPSWEGSQVLTDAESARQAVRALPRGPYAFAKVYNGLSAAVYQAIVDEATLLGIPVAGHVPAAVGLDAVIDGPQRSIEHLHRYPTLLQHAEPTPEDLAVGEGGWLTADPSLFPGLAGRLASDGVWSAPTLALREAQALSPVEREVFLRRPEVAWVAPELRGRWRTQSLTEASSRLVRDGQAARLAMVRALNEQGAPLLAGSDVGNPYLIPGLSLHDELRLLVQAGLTPFEALSAATRSAAEFLGQQGDFGVVRVGARADLILVAGDPLRDVANALRRRGVMVRGVWFTLDELTARLGTGGD